MKVIFRSKELVLGMTNTGKVHIAWCKTGDLLKYNVWAKITIAQMRMLRKKAVQDRQIKKLMKDDHLT